MKSLFISFSFLLGLSLKGQGLDCSFPAQSEYNLKEIYNTTFVDLISFAEVINYTGAKEILKAKLNYPGFPSQPRPKKIPTICLLHGGGFKSDDTKNSPLMVLFQDYFYKRGFLVVTADYRQGWEGSKGFCGTGSLNDFEDAQYRAFQDTRALVRYLKAKSNDLGVDTNAIFLLGTSAGGINILNFYAKEHSLETPDRIARLGKLDGNGNNYDYSINVAGIITAAGSTVNLSNIQKNIPLMMIHGTCDAAVPFGEGKLIDCPNLSYMFGSYRISEQMKLLGFPSELHSFCGFGHDIGSQFGDPDGTKPSYNYWKKAASDFIYKILCNKTADFEDKLANDFMQSSPTDSCTNFEFYQLCTNNKPIKEFKIGIFPSYISTFDHTAIKVISNEETEISYEIFDFYGIRKTSGKIKVSIGYNEIPLVLDNLSAGPNIVIFYKKGVKCFTQKIVVKSPLGTY
jgi:hypothetical protein